MKVLTWLTDAVASVVIGFNLLGGLVGGVWLAITGNWWALGYGLASMLIGTAVIKLGLIPSAVCAAGAATALVSRRLRIARIFGALSLMYTYTVMGIWTVVVTGLFLRHGRTVSLVPVLLFTYGAALSPWAYLASKEQPTDSGNMSALAVSFGQVGFLVGALCYLLFPANALWFIVPFAAILLFGLGVHLAIGLASLTAYPDDSPFADRSA